MEYEIEVRYENIGPFHFIVGYLQIKAVALLLNNGKYFSWNVYKRDCRFDACRCSSLIDDYVVIGKNDVQERTKFSLLLSYKEWDAKFTWWYWIYKYFDVNINQLLSNAINKY